MVVREIKNIKSLEGFHLIAGANGLEQDVENVVIFEYESIHEAPEHYYKGDFMVSTLMFAKDESQLILPTFQRLVDLGVTGLAIKAGYFSELPEEVMAFADQTGLPIFWFSDTYIEDVIVSINDYMKSQENYSMYESEFHKIIYGNLPEVSVVKKAMMINPTGDTNLTMLYLMPSKDSKRGVLFDIFGAASRRKNKKWIENEFRLYQYRNGIFILYNGKENDFQKSKAALEGALIRLEVNLNQIIYGISQVHTGVKDFDLCIKESFFSCGFAQFHKITGCEYDKLGMYRFMIPLLLDKLSRTYYLELKQKIVDYDTNHHMDLLGTLCLYTQLHEDMKNTAKELFQHPNTVRYRMQKVEEILGIADENETAHTVYLIALLTKMEDFIL